jgi:HprK-related kinase A
MFQAEDSRPLAPFPRDHAFALLEWGVNWCIATRAHQYLMLHAGAVERDGRALILPAMPGSGKSTLTAALIARGWRLLSDEFGLLDHQSGRLHPLPRAIPLKNRSIDVIRRFWPDADIGPVFTRTRKGDVAHLRPPAASLIRQAEPADPAWILFPQYVSGSPVQIGRQPQSQVFTRLSQNAFNYNLLGAVGFRSLSALVRDCPCWSIRYGDLDAVIAAIGRLTGTDGS